MALVCLAIILAVATLGSCNSLLDPGSAGVHSQTIVTGGLIRYYDWAAPDGNQPRPVLLAFHGLGGNATEFRENSELLKPALDAGYVLAFPQASNEAGRGWSMGCDNCTDGDRLGISDVAYVDAVLDDLAKRTTIDRTRVYVTGFSMGGWFSYAMACQRSSMVKAIVPVGGLMPRPVAALCTPTQPIGAMVIFGDQDPTQPYAGRAGPYGLFGADSSALFWSNASQCGFATEQRQTFGNTQVDVMQIEQCRDGVRVERHRVVGLAHVWPKGNYSATRELLRFFAEH